jgi:3-hydroxybutyryl-CoA dehydrogenase
VAIERVGIVGFGQMGSGIAQVCAMAGLDVLAREIDQKFIEKGFARIDSSLARVVRSGKVSDDDAKKARGRIRGTTALADFKDRDLVIEAVIEVMDAKREVFEQLDRVCPPATIFASNTSSLTIIAMATASGRPDRMLGIHFFNPVPLMKLVEVVRTITTSEETEQRALDFVRALGKEPIRAKDSSGFVVNLLLIPYMVDAIKALESNVASVEDIDKGMQLGAGHPMGPFTLLDFVGLDTVYKIAEIMFAEYRESRYAPPPLLKRMVLAGMLGRKSGKGFYDYSSNPPRVSSLGL